MRNIFFHSFSTAEMITDISGRGIGMDVVKSQVGLLHSSVDASSQAGFGSSFILSVPLTLTTIAVLIVETAGHTYVIPSASVRRLVRFSPSETSWTEGHDVLTFGGAPVPVASLAATPGLGHSSRATKSGKLVGRVLTSRG